MKVAKFSLYMLNKDKRKSIFYIMTCAFSVMVMFVFLNLNYNTYFNDLHGLAMYGMLATEMFVVMFSYVIIAIVVGMSFSAYNFYLSSQTKEIGIYMLGGSKMSRLFNYLFTQNCVIYLVAMCIGIPIGCILVPLVNLWVSTKAGIECPIFVYSATAFWGTIGLTICTLFYLALVATGFIHRHEIKELIGMKKEMKKRDERMLEVPKILYLLLIIMPIIAFMTQKDPDVALVFSFVAVLGGFKGFSLYVLPKWIQTLQRKVLITHRLGLVSSGNFHQSLINACGTVRVFLLVVFILNGYMLSNSSNLMNVAIVYVGYIFVIISIALSIAYKVLLDVKDKSQMFIHLHHLGYQRHEIKKIIRQEVVGLFAYIYFFFFVYSALFYLPHVFNKTVNVGFMIQNLGVVTLVVLATGIFCYNIYKNNVIKEL